MAYTHNRPFKKLSLGFWNRLEARPTRENYAQALTAETYDPLWLLTRQWQFGEFKGEDTGTAVFTHVETEHSKMSRFAPENTGFGNTEVYNDRIPVEARVEAEQVPFDLKTHLQISMYWRKLLKAYFPYSSFQALYDAFKNAYRLNVTTGGNPVEEANQGVFPKAQVLQQTGRWLLNGAQLYQDFKATVGVGNSIMNLLPQTLALSTTQVNDLGNLALGFLHWFEGLFIQPTTNTSWKPENMEYQFAHAVPSSDPQAPKTAIVAQEYYHGKLDWYNYTIAHGAHHNLVGAASLPNEQVEVTTQNRTMLPGPVRYRGMPVPRFWEFEDGVVDFGKFYENTTDLPQALLAQFGLIYSNDWQIVPYKVPVGSLSTVKKIVVTDVFGQKTVVNAANQKLDPTWQSWSMFNLNQSNAPLGSYPDNRLFMPPTVHKSLESEPIEEVLFTRDEMNNLVWGIERVIASPLGERTQWNELVRKRKAQLQTLVNFNNASPATPLVATDFVYDYITNEIPENWIPFIRVQRTGQPDRRYLQRGKMERYWPNVPGTARFIQPMSVLLQENTSNAGTGVYFLKEEEVPRAGILVTCSFQRTRWFGGKVINWLGRQKRAGVGESNSNLAFDTLQHSEKTSLQE
ncbi:hypothetical protein BKI52_19400 [marine bacterium AO1-C]|nr:hypothetical protein BKI52_19400 [marine bacterium AO1-C]